MSIKRKDRTEINDFLIISKTEIDRLMEQSPFIPFRIISKFNHHFKNKLNFELPSELDIINPTYIYNEKKEKIDIVILNDYLLPIIPNNQSINNNPNNYSIIMFPEDDVV